MSIERMTSVWQHSQHKGSTLLLMLAIADNADHNGFAFPGIKHLAKKTRLSIRQVLRLVSDVEKTNELVVDRSKKYNRYIVNVWPPDGIDLDTCETCGIPGFPQLDNPLHKHHIIPTSEGGLDHPSNIELLCKLCHLMHHNGHIGDKMSRDNLSLIERFRAVIPSIGDISNSLSDISDPIGDAGDTLTVTKNHQNESNIKDGPQTKAIRAWASVHKQLQQEMPKATFDTWVKEVECHGFENGTILLGVANSKTQEWLESRLTSTIGRLLMGFLDLDKLAEVKFILSDSP